MEFENRIEKICFFIFCFNFFFMIRGYFVANLLESTVLILLLAESSLRARFLESITSYSFFPVLLFLIWILVTGFWGEFGQDSLDDFFSWRKLLILAFGLVLVNSDEKLKFLIQVILSTGGIFLILILISWSMELEILNRAWFRVAQNHTAQGVFLIYLATMLVFLHLFWWRQQKPAPSWNLLVGLLVLTCITLTVSSPGRGGIVLLLSFLLAGGLCSILKGGYQNVRVAVGLLIGCLVIVIGSFIVNPRVELGIVNALGAFDSNVNTSMGIRVIMWANTLNVIAENLFFGTGSGAFAKAYDQVVVNDGSWRDFSTDNPHQQFLHIWAEYGLVGLTLILLWFWRLFKLAGSESNVSSLVIVYSIVAIIVLGMFNGVLGSFVEGRIILYGLVIGVYLANKKFGSEARHDC